LKEVEMSEEQQGNTRWEELKVTGDQLVDTVKRLFHEGNVRRVVIKNAEGQTYLEIPLTVGLVGAVLLPLWAALGALAAIAGGLTIAVERVDDKDPSPPST
jgi:hypothetical protein